MLLSNEMASRLEEMEAVFMQRVNTAKNIACLLRSSFRTVKQISFPFRLKHLRIYLFFECTNPISEL